MLSSRRCWRWALSSLPRRACGIHTRATARDLRWLGTAYTADGHMRVTVLYWRGLDPAALPSYWYTFVKSSVFSGEIVATEDGGFRLRHYWGSGRGCGPPIAVRQVSPRVLRFRVRDTTNPGQPVTALTAKDSIQLGEFVGDPPAC